MTKRALIVIDVQYDYFSGGAWALPASEQALPNIVRRINLARERGELVVFIQHLLPEGAPVFAQGTKGSLLHDDLNVQPEDAVLHKTHPSSFQDTDLQAFLSRHSIEEVDICGFMTQMCCDTTTREAYSRGYKVRFFSDATAARDLESNGETIPHNIVHQAELVTLARFATILAVQDA